MKRRAIWASAILILICNIFFLYYFWTRKQSTIGARVPLAEELIEKWISSNSIPIEDFLQNKMLHDIIANNRGVCDALTLPPNAIDISDLEASSLENLHIAVHDLLLAFIKDSPQAVFNYMLERKEHIPKTYQQQLAEILKQHGIKPEKVDKMNAKELFIETWNYSNAKNKWDGYLENNDCVVIYRLEQFDRNNPQLSLGRNYKTIFKAITRINHLFFGLQQPEKVSKEDGVILADFCLVFNTESHQDPEPCVVFLRFWYNSIDQSWHPLELAMISPISDETPLILF